MTLLDSTLSTTDADDARHYEFSPRAIVPRRITFPLPLPGTAEFQKVRGRCGDMLILQMRSGSGQVRQRRQALRSLGLHGPRSAALKLSRDSSVWGQIEAVRDLVAVILLPSVIYTEYASDSGKSDTEVSVENYAYGTSSQPARMWRDLEGQFFAYESKNDSLAAFWSSTLALSAVVAALPKAGMQIDFHSERAFLQPEFNGEISSPKNDDVERHDVVDGTGAGLEGPWEVVAKDTALESCTAAAIPMVGGFELTWQAPFRRFYDVDKEWFTVGVNSSPPDILAVRSLARVTGNALFFNGGCTIELRQQGALRTYIV